MDNIYRCRVCGAYVEEARHCGVDAELFLDRRRREQLSKLMSGLLRHFPEQAGLKLNDEGFTSLRELAEAIRTRWIRRELYQWVTEEHLLAIALLDPKGRFEVKEGLIRARYGHSVSVKLKLVEDRKVKVLYHGTAAENLSRILGEGLKPMKRLYVHLTSSFEDAVATGRRHSQRVAILEVDCEALRRLGIKIFKAGRSVYLAERVPPSCIKRAVQL